VGTGLAIVYLYQREFGDTAIYVMDHNSAFYPLDRRGLLTMLLPAIAAMSVTGILMGWLLTLGASRRIALPVYKVTQWARRVSEGDLHVRLGFRKGDGLDGLAETCNAALDTMRSSLGEIERMSQDEKIPEPVRHRLGEIVSRYRL
jgi:methyl-accepting chemotaxis protein